MRYFYTDPLAATWMAKHYGMRFRYNNGDVFQDSGEWFTLPMEMPSYLFFIHPDSLHLLEPQVGDVLRKGATDKTRVDLRLVDAGVNDHEFWLTISKKFIERGYQIIQRKGLAFMWPETE